MPYSNSQAAKVFQLPDGPEEKPQFLLVNLTVCPLDGSKLVRRKGLDDVDTIKKRLDIFKEQTFPVVECVEKEGLAVNKVNGEQTVSDVFKDVYEITK